MIATSPISSLAELAFAQIATLCPSSKFPHTLAGPNGTPGDGDDIDVDLAVPHFIVMKNVVEPLVDPSSGDQLTVQFDQVIDGMSYTISYKLYYGVALACSDKAYYPLLLSPINGPEAADANGNGALETFTTDIRYLCLKTREAGEPQGGSWKCGEGRVGSGVVGYAVKKGTLSPRPFYAGNLKWGQNHFDRHFMFSNNHGAIAEPIVNQSGYTNSEGWGLNPLTGSGNEFVAAVALKTSTNRSGVWVSPYNEPVTSLAPPSDVGRLHQCENGYRNEPDLASSGTFEQGFLVDLQVSDWYQSAGESGDCHWVNDWDLQPMQLDSNAPCDAAALDNGTVLGLNRADVGAGPRCPSWIGCMPGQSCCISQVSTGAHFTCVTKADGTAQCFGRDSDGQLGRDGAAVAHDRRVQNHATGQPLDKIRAVVASRGTYTGMAATTGACALRADATVWCWGGNELGQLGDGTFVDRGAAAPVSSLSNVVELEVGGEHACARRGDGTLWCWGANDQGQLGNGSTANSAAPIQVANLGSNVAEVALGDDHGCAKKTDDTLWCWGNNSEGQLGVGTVINSSQPLQVTAVAGQVERVSAAGRHVCVIKKDRRVWCWGYGASGQLGNGTYSHQSLPVEVSGLGTETAVLELGNKHSCARKNDGTLWCWGYGGFAQLGTGTGDSSKVPVQVVSLGAEVASMTLGNVHSCARKTDGSLWCWGYNSSAEVSEGLPSKVYSPAPVTTVHCRCGDGVCGVDETPQTCAIDCRTATCGDGRCAAGEVESCPGDCPSSAVQLAAGRGHSCALKGDGSLACWGSASYGQVGVEGAPSRATIPLQVTTLGTDVLEVTLGKNYSCARRADGTLWCWGRPYSGELGPGITGTQYVPVQNTALGNDVTQVRAADRHICALKGAGTLWCWGANTHGELGDGTRTASAAPVHVAALGANVAQVAPGGGHTCALKTDGTVWCWGYGSWGQLGNGAFSYSRSTPTRATSVGGGVIQIASGDKHSCALKADGTVWCWGTNTNGQTGNGFTDPFFSATATQVAALGSDVVQVSLGYRHSCAVKTDGTLWCWGYNATGQLGDGSKDDSAFPRFVAALGSHAEEVTSGWMHTCARKDDGTVWCWGANFYGQLGTGNLTSSSVPRQAASCGDTLCQQAELGVCALDCSVPCGDGICDAMVESAASCPADC